MSQEPQSDGDPAGHFGNDNESDADNQPAVCPEMFDQRLTYRGPPEIITPIQEDVDFQYYGQARHWEDETDGARSMVPMTRDEVAALAQDNIQGSDVRIQPVPEVGPQLNFGSIGPFLEPLITTGAHGNVTSDQDVRESFNGSNLSDSVIDNLLEQRLIYLGVDNRVKCRDCHHRSSVYDEEHHKPGCRFHTQALNGEPDQQANIPQDYAYSVTGRPVTQRMRSLSPELDQETEADVSHLPDSPWSITGNPVTTQDSSIMRPPVTEISNIEDNRAALMPTDLPIEEPEVEDVQVLFPPVTTTQGTQGLVAMRTATSPNSERQVPAKYANVGERLTSYGGWPSNRTQTPQQLAEAGLNYTGEGDCVKCFFCGGGLRNWEADDNPLVEHARLYPRCPFINRQETQDRLQQMGQQQAQGELQSIEHTGLELASGTSQFMTAPTEQPSQTIPERRAGNQIPNDRLFLTDAAQSVLEFGYHPRTVNKAIEIVIREHGHDGLNAQIIMEKVLQLEEAEALCTNLPRLQLDNQMPESTRTKTSKSKLKKPIPARKDGLDILVEETCGVLQDMNIQASESDVRNAIAEVGRHALTKNLNSIVELVLKQKKKDIKCWMCEQAHRDGRRLCCASYCDRCFTIVKGRERCCICKKKM